MKKLIENYTFNPTTKEIVFLDYTTINLERILIITNVTSNIIIYNFANSLQGGTVSNNILTLNYNTSSMSNTDKLQIYYETIDTPSSEQTQKEIYNLTETLYELINRLDFLSAVRGNAADLRVTLTASAFSSVGTVTTLSNQTNIGGSNAATQIKDLDNMIFIASNLNNIN